MPSRRADPQASPARSTRSARSRTREQTREEDDWEAESMTSGSFKVPGSRSKKAGNAIGLKDTSVNIAAAFHAAQTGHLPLPSHPNASVSSNSSTSRSLQVPRAISPAEQLAQSARALSPVRFFLRPTEEDGDDYTSFSSVGIGNTDELNTSGEGESYDYRQEEEFVRQAQQQKMAKAKARAEASASVKNRRVKALDEDMPYRPAEEDTASIASSDSGGGGDGLVKSGALQGRAETRGKRLERGEGYLGMGLGIQPRRRRKSRKNGMGGDESEEDGTPGTGRAWTPAVEVDGHRRSPTPLQLLRGRSPMMDRKSPVPLGAYQQRRRPSDIRTIVTNVLHGVVIGLQFVVELGTTVLYRIIVCPLEKAFGSSKGFVRRAKTDWWKWLGTLLGISLALRFLDNAFRTKGIYTAPDAPPSTIDEMSIRLTSLEHATATLSDLLRAISEGDNELHHSAVTLKSKVDEIEDAVSAERKRVEGVRGELKKEKVTMQSEIDKLRDEIHILSSQVGKHENSISSDRSAKSLQAVEGEITQLKSRMEKVEQNVHVALEDGRLVAALERILPQWMPIRTDSQGNFMVEPAFWTEMKKVMVGKGEVEQIVRRLIGEAGVPDNGTKESPVDEHKVVEWMEKAFDRHLQGGLWVTREEFTSTLNKKLQELARETPEKPTSKRAAASSTVTIKSSKGEDLTSLLNSLIDTALLRYSKDTIARADYALFTAGARVIPHLTSNTFTLQKASTFGKLLWASKDVQGRPPATALHPDTSVGSCWPIKGSEGSLGVMLVDRVVVSDVTIEHAPQELALDIATAPKVVKVLGLVDYTEGLEKLAEYRAAHEMDLNNEEDTNYLPLGTFTYDPSSYSHIQTFPVSPDIVELGIRIGVVVFKIESNWGGDLTCLYRVRVHGNA
ncbi:hypothetical protein C366_01159 [Cryptococcus neoformans Tu401-1]|nr:hypothetical protein C365_01228 [Cryptococcus neoformans var. grubii Bt85]OXG22260.1 hypothetical protein C366_01159 [Cryptococcus neoformans var. grubii Tu401-1]